MKGRQERAHAHTSGSEAAASRPSSSLKSKREAKRTARSTRSGSVPGQGGRTRAARCVGKDREVAGRAQQQQLHEFTHARTHTYSSVRLPSKNVSLGGSGVRITPSRRSARPLEGVGGAGGRRRGGVGAQPSTHARTHARRSTDACQRPRVQENAAKPNNTTRQEHTHERQKKQVRKP